MSAQSPVSHRCPHCGKSNGWRGPLRDRIRFEDRVSRSLAQGRCRHCQGLLLAKEDPVASALMGVSFFSLAALFVHSWMPLPPWGVLAAMAVFSAALIVWLGIRVTGRGFQLKAAPPEAQVPHRQAANLDSDAPF